MCLSVRRPLWSAAAPAVRVSLSDATPLFSPSWRLRLAMLVLGLVIGLIGEKDGFAGARRTLEARTKMLGAAHPDTIDAMQELARVLRNSRVTEYRREGLALSRVTEYRREGLALEQKLKMLYAKPRAEKQQLTMPQAKQPHGVGDRHAKLQPGFKPSSSAKLLSQARTARTSLSPVAKQPWRKKLLPASSLHAGAPTPPHRRSAVGLPPPRLRQACPLPHLARPVEMMNCSADGNIERRRWCINCVLS